MGGTHSDKRLAGGRSSSERLAGGRSPSERLADGRSPSERLAGGRSPSERLADGRSPSERLWYAAFGSNLSRQRFLTYLRGGRPHLAEHEEAGARDPQPPLADLPWAVEHEMYFALSSKRWRGGSVAFLDPHQADLMSGPTLCRLFQISVQQFEDVHRQENGAAEAVPLDMEALLASGEVEQYPRNYGLAKLLGHYDDLPIVTLTAATRRDPATRTGPPDPTYLFTMGSGLNELHGLAFDDVVEYLLSKEGVREFHTSTSLRDCLLRVAETEFQANEPPTAR